MSAYLQCPKCDGTVSVDASATRVTCPSCRATLLLSYEDEEGLDEDTAALQDILRMFMSRRAKGRDEEETSSLHRCKGLSNVQCKLLGPIFTHYIAKISDQSITTVQRTLSMPEDQQPHVRLCDLPAWAFNIEPELLEEKGYGVDQAAEIYLESLLDKIQRVNGDRSAACLFVDGDGHCLVHSISRCIAGQEFYWHLLRTDLHHRLRVDRDKYLERYPQFTDEFDKIIEEASPSYVPPKTEMHGLQPVHVFALANALKRPIILFDGQEGQLDGTQGCFLPLLHDPADCKSRKPIAIAWSNRAHVHFVAVCPIKLVGKDTLATLSVGCKEGGGKVSLEPKFLSEDMSYRVCVPGNATVLDLSFETGGARPVYVPYDALPQQDGLPVVWGAPSREDGLELLHKYIEFTPHPEDSSTLCCVLGGSFTKDFSAITKLMDMKFSEINKFPTEFAREVLLGLETTMRSIVSNYTIEETIEWSQLLRHSVFYCPKCTKTITLERHVNGPCKLCDAELRYSITMEEVPCPSCKLSFRRIPHEINSGEAAHDFYGSSSCTECHCKDLRPYNVEKGGFVLKNGDRTRIKTEDFRGCCGYKHIYSADGAPILEKSPAFDFVHQKISIALKDGKKFETEIPMVDFKPDALARELVEKHCADYSFENKMKALEGIEDILKEKLQKNLKSAEVLQEYRRCKGRLAKVEKIAEKAKHMTPDEMDVVNGIALSRGLQTCEAQDITSIEREAKKIMTKIHDVYCDEKLTLEHVTRLMKEYSRDLHEKTQRLLDHFATDKRTFSTPGRPSVKVNGRPTVNNYCRIPINSSTKKIEVEVTAADGSSKRTYVIEIMRTPSPLEPVAKMPNLCPSPTTQTAAAAPVSAPTNTANASSAMQTGAAPSVQSPERTSTSARVKVVLPTGASLTLNLGLDEPTCAIYNKVASQYNITNFALHFTVNKKQVPNSETLTLREAGVDSAKLDVVLPKTQDEGRGDAAAPASGAHPFSGAASLSATPSVKGQVFRRDSHVYKVIQDIGLVDKNVYTIPEFFGKALFYDKASDTVVKETGTNDDLRPGGVIYEFIKSQTTSLRPYGRYTLSKLDREYMYNPDTDSLVLLTTFERNAPASVEKAEAKASMVSFAGEGHRLGSNRSWSGHPLSSLDPTYDLSTVSSQNADLMRMLSAVSGRLWRTEPSGQAAPSLGSEASQGDATAGDFLASGGLLRTLSSQEEDTEEAAK